MSLAASAVKAGRLVYSGHANQRLLERQIIKPEIEAVLINGHHEVRKDQFDEHRTACD
jgi:hypothetical protein